MVMDKPIVINIGGLYIKLNFSGLKEEQIKSFLNAVSPVLVNSITHDTEVSICGLRVTNSREALSRMEQENNLLKRVTGWHNSAELAQRRLARNSIIATLLRNEKFREAWQRSKEANLDCYIYDYWGVVLYENSPLRYSFYVLDDDKFRLREKARNFILEHLLYFLFLHILERLSKGMLLHAAGVKDRNKAAMLLAESGGGKTTATRILQEYERDIRIFSDENTYLVEGRDRNYYISSMPFKEARIINVGNEVAPLKVLFFLKKAENPQLKKISKVDALQRFLRATSLLRINNEKAVNQNSFSFSSRLVESLPAYELSFRKDKNFWPICEEVL